MHFSKLSKRIGEGFCQSTRDGITPRGKLCVFSLIVLLQFFTTGGAADNPAANFAEKPAAETEITVDPADQAATPEEAGRLGPPQADTLVFNEGTFAVSVDGKSVRIGPGEYRLSAHTIPELILQPIAGGEAITIVAEQLANDPNLLAGSALIIADAPEGDAEEGEASIIFVTDSGEVLRALLKQPKVQSRSIVVYPRPDLRVTISGPGTTYSPLASTWSMRVYSYNAASSNVRVRFSLCVKWAGPYGINDCWKLESASGASCRIIERDYTWDPLYDKEELMECTVPSIAANSRADVSLRMKFVSSQPGGGWGTQWSFRPLVDPDYQIRETDELNNYGAATFRIHKKTNLAANFYPKCFKPNRNTTASLELINSGSYSVSGIKMELSTPGFYIGSVTPANNGSGFSCSFNSSTSKITCINGRMGGDIDKTRISYSLRPKSSAKAAYPAILSIDPDSRISERTENDNFKTVNYEVDNYCY